MNAPAKMFSSGRQRDVVLSDPMAMYRPKETYSERVTTFLTKPVKKSFERLLEVWSALDKAADAESKDWSDAEALRRFVEAGVDSAWAELGGEPQDEEGLKKLISTSVAAAKKQKAEAAKSSK